VRASTIIMIAFAVVFGLLAVVVAQSWLNNQAAMRMKSIDAQQRPVSTHTIVVASKPLRFGTELSKQTLREVVWPENALPVGAFSTINEIISAGRRVVLTAIELNEPVLNTKITGPGQRATLSAVIREGFRAVTVRVNDVEGVGGFILPGDRVDVMLTRQIDKNSASSDVVLQNTRVLAIDQIAGEADASYTRRITISDLTTSSAPVAVERKGASTAATVEVVRGTQRQEYSVPTEGKNQRTEGNGLRAAEVGEPLAVGN